MNLRLARIAAHGIHIVGMVWMIFVHEEVFYHKGKSQTIWNVGSNRDGKLQCQELRVRRREKGCYARSIATSRKSIGYR